MASISEDQRRVAERSTFGKLFQPERLSIGIIAPVRPYPDGATADMHDHAQLARQTEQAGFAALWLRDVPFHDPGFGGLGQVYDPLVYAGWLASITTSIAIGTAGIVLPLRDPVFVAKQAASIDQLAGGRFLLGLSSGDRPAEYPAIGRNFEDRASRYRDAVKLMRTLTGTTFPRYRTEHYGVLNGGLDLVPKPLSQLPMLAIGRAGHARGPVDRATPRRDRHRGQL